MLTRLTSATGRALSPSIVGTNVVRSRFSRLGTTTQYQSLRYVSRGNRVPFHPLYSCQRQFKVFAAQAEHSGSLVERALQTCRRIVKWLARLAAISLLLAAAVPTVLSTGPGLQMGTRLASHFTDGDIEIHQAELGWLKPIHLTDVKYKLPAALGGDVLASAQSLSTKSRLWDVIVGRKYDVYGQDPWLDCTFSSSGKWKWTELSNYAAGKQVGGDKQNSNPPDTKPQPGLVMETAEVAFSAEARLLTASLYFPKGIMKVPQEVKEVVGNDLHMVAVLGKNCLQEAVEDLELDQDVSWALESESAHPSASKSDGSKNIDDAESPESSPDRLGTKETSSWLNWETLDPGIVSIQSKNLNLRASGWRRRADGAYLLNQPGRLEFQYTPALAQYVLGRLSPLLSEVLAVENGIVGVDVAPDNLISPAETYRFRIEPLRIAVQKQGLLKTAIEFLQWRKGGVEKSTLLQGCTSALHVDVHDDGSIDTKRLDLLVSTGGSSKGVHLCSWGSIKPMQDKLDINLGIPAEMLSYLGARGLQKKDMLVVPVTGTFTRPTIDWKGAYSRLSALARSRQGEVSSITDAILQGIATDVYKRIGGTDSLETPSPTPAPLEPLPWVTDKDILDSVVQPND